MKEHNLNPEEFLLDEIVSIELIGDDKTIDISVEDIHMFFCNDIYTHNSSAESEIIVASQVSEDYSKIMTADLVISLARPLKTKLGGTGSWHIIKNRFGPDGLTFPSKINTTNGSIQIFDETSIEGKNTKIAIQNGDEVVRKTLAAKYDQLKTSTNSNLTKFSN